jgi:hypothetical protein
MMLGGGLMIVFGLLFLLLIIAIPVVLVIALAGGKAGLLNKQNEATPVYQQPGNSTSNPVVRTDLTAPVYPRYCAHCGAGLQEGWTHCPQCGAPIS